MGNSPKIDIQIIKKMFPEAHYHHNIHVNYRLIEHALNKYGLSTELKLYAYATIRVETPGFNPVHEYQSKYNTLLPRNPKLGPQLVPDDSGGPWSLYDNRLGNTEEGDGFKYEGRGFIQLTGKANYLKYGNLIGQPLERHPDLALRPDIAAEILAVYILQNKSRIEAALAKGNLAAARKVVNGGHHGLAAFDKAYNAGLSAIRNNDANSIRLKSN